jgi:capsular exopolysaccharide synthesis family protein
MARKVIDALQLEAMFSAKDAPTVKPFYADFITKLQASLRSDTTNSNGLSSTEHKSTGDSAEALFLGGLAVSGLGKSHLVSISYESIDPELSANIVNSLTQQFIQMNLDSRVDSTSHAKIFLEGEMTAAKEKLRASEKKMLLYEKENTVVDSSGDNSLMRQRLISINKAYAQAKQERISAETSQAGFAAPIQNVQLLPENNLQIRSLEVKVKTLGFEYDRLNKDYQEQLKIYKPSFPSMAEKRAMVDEVKMRLDMMKDSIQAEKALIISTNKRLKAENQAVITSKSGLLAAAHKKEAAMKAELNAAKAESIAQREQAIKYREIEEEVKANRDLYDSLLKKQKEVGVSGGIDSNNISVVDPAVVTYNKYKPNTKMNLALGSLVGLILGSMLALLFGSSETKIKSVEDIRDISALPLLGKIPKVKLKGKSNGAVHAMDKSSSVIAEAFRSLRTSLMFSTPEGLPKLLHITSSESNEGKSNIAHNLASVFVQAGKSVLLIDADLRKPLLNRYLNIEVTTGLSAYLQGSASIDDVIVPTGIPNFNVIVGSAVDSAPADLLSNDRMLNLLEHVSDEFDLVIIDSPPVLGIADALILSNRAVATLFVIESNKTNQKSLENALERLRMGYGNVIGFVLSKSKDLKSEAYTYKYGDAERIG